MTQLPHRKTSDDAPAEHTNQTNVAKQVEAVLQQELAGDNTIARSRLIELLHNIQQQCGYIPSSAIANIADKCNITQAEIYGVISFYDDFVLSDAVDVESFSLPIIHICRAEACQAVGGRELFRSLSSQLVHKAQIKSVYCLGNCALAPAVMVNGKCLGRANYAQVNQALSSI